MFFLLPNIKQVMYNLIDNFLSIDFSFLYFPLYCFLLLVKKMPNYVCPQKVSFLFVPYISFLVSYWLYFWFSCITSVKFKQLESYNTKLFVWKCHFMCIVFVSYTYLVFVSFCLYFLNFHLTCEVQKTKDSSLIHQKSIFVSTLFYCILSVILTDRCNMNFSAYF